MELLISRIVSRIRSEMPSLLTVDEDYGQLDALLKDDVDQYPLTFPAVLIDGPETEWSHTASGTQRGVGRLRVRLIIDCYDDTHYGSEPEERIMERAAMADTLHYALQRFRPLDDGELMREKSSFFTFSHGIKVYESFYTVALTDIPPQETVSVAPPAVRLAVRPAAEASREIR